MLTTKAKGYKSEVDFHPEPADRKPILRPKITKEEFIEGVRYYIGQGKIYLADQFDKFFKPQVRLTMRKKQFKGDLIGGGAAWQ